MNKHIAAVKDCKDNIAPASHGDALRAFYARLAATNAPGHPWLTELASIISAHEDAKSDNSKVDAINHAVEILDDLLLIARDEVGNLGTAGDRAESTIAAARRFVGDIREYNNQKVGLVEVAA